MKSFCFLLLVFVVFAQCTPKKSSEVTGPSPFTAAAYHDGLHSKPITRSSALRGLELFKNYFSSQPDSLCDQYLREYLTYSAVVADSLSRQLSRQPDFDKLTASYLDPNGKDEATKTYEAELNKNALLLQSFVGDLSIGYDPDKIASTFSERISPATKAYLTQWVIEEKQPWATDAGFIISAMDLAKRAAFWDAFAEKNPHNIFVDKARAITHSYLSFLMTGIDNTPAFSPDDQTLLPEFADAFNFLATNYPAQECGKVMAAYLKIIKDNNNHRTEAVDQFIKKYKQ